MDAIEGLIYLSSAWPLWQAWRANRGTTLRHALAWATAAWLAWSALLLPDSAPAALAAFGYLALCLTGCAGVAVLGAREPIAGPWNFVLLGLLAVLLLPWAENVLLGTPLLDPLRLAFILATLTVSALNHLPTRLCGMVLVLGVACGAELVLLLALNDPAAQACLLHGSRLAVPLACWLAWGMTRRPVGLSKFDRLWLAFRDRFGLLWGQRLREQFNSAAAHAGWAAQLRWRGLCGAAATVEMVEALRALLKRFGSVGSAEE